MNRFAFMHSFIFAVAMSVAIQRLHAVTIDTVPVGNPGNAADTRYDPAGFGAVGYNYRIGKTEVTNGQYVEFLNGVDPTGANTLGLAPNYYPSFYLGIRLNGLAPVGSKYSVPSDYANMPVVNVSWHDSIRFANWLHNGQGNGITEDGAYTISGNFFTIVRNPNAKWWIPSDDEWYKAAYHKNDGATGNYWDYPTSTDVIPYSDQSPGSGAPTQSNTANFYRDDGVANGYNDGYAVTGEPYPSSTLNYYTDVGAYALSVSPYGTFDQGGNVWEWNDTLVGGAYRHIRGGSFETQIHTLQASFSFPENPVSDIAFLGFRVASVATIPEPSTLLLLCFGSLAVLWRRRGLVCAFILAAVIGNSYAASARADIFQWEYINPADPSQGKQQGTTLCPDGAGLNAVPGSLFLYNRNLTRAYLIGSDLRNSDMSGSNLTVADLSHANLGNVNFTNATLTDAHFSQANFTNARLVLANLTDADLRQVILTGANLGYTTLTGADFHGADVRHADFFRDPSWGDAATTGITPAQLQSTGSYQALDLTGVKLFGNILNGANLAGQNLTDSTWDRAKLVSANFSQSNLTNALMEAVTLTGSDLSQSNLTNAKLVGAILAGANFAGADVRGTDFTRDSSFYQQVGTGITVPQLYATASHQARDLSGVNFTGNNLAGADFAGQILVGATFASSNTGDLSGANFSGADARGVNFDSANLTAADMSQADLSNARLYRAALTSANLNQANLANANLELSNLSDANLSQANLTGATLDLATLTGASLNQANLTNASLNLATLTGADFTGAEVRGALLGPGFTAAQLYSTASYQARDLTGVRFWGNDLTGVSFAGQNLTNATFYSTLTGADFTGAEVRGADFSTSDPLSETSRISLAQLYSTASYQAHDLTGIDLSGNNLTAANFGGQNLTNAGFTAVTLTNANLSQANLTNANFQAARMAGANFSQANLSNADFYAATLDGASFTGAEIRGANFTRDSTAGISLAQIASTASYQAHDLTGINFTRNDLRNANAVGQNLTNAVFYSATVSNVNFSQANLTNANFTDAALNGANFSGAEIRGADFTRSFGTGGITPAQLASTANYQAHDLTGINFTGTTLAGANLSGQNLTGANFNFTKLGNANFTQANLTNATFHNQAVLTVVNFRQANLTGASLQFANLANANFSQANLTNANLNHAYLGGAVLTGAEVRGANFGRSEEGGFIAGGITLAQLYATASYLAHDLTGVGLEGNSLSGASLSGQNLTNAGFGSATVTDANFSQANLTNAYFAGAVLSGANFSQANLTGTYLAGADFSSVNVTGAEVRGARLGRVTVAVAVCPVPINCHPSWNVSYAGVGIDLAQLQTTASFQASNLSGVDLTNVGLSGANFAGFNLSGANFTAATLTGIAFAGADVRGANFRSTTSSGFTAAQLYSTASYQARDLRGIDLSFNNLSGWNLAGQNLTRANFSGAPILGVNFTGADIRGSYISNADLQGATTTNLIRADGKIEGLTLNTAQQLVIRDYDGSPTAPFPLPPVPITVKQHLTMNEGGTLRLVFEADAWDSTISFDPNIPVSRGGALEPSFAPDVNLSTQIGRTFKLFDWTGVTPTGVFTVSSPYTWNLSNLYTTGEVTLTAAPGIVPGDFNGNGTVDAADYVIWRKGIGVASTQDNYNIWRQYFGQTSFGGASTIASANVPEPTTLPTLTFAAACLLLQRCRTRRRLIRTPLFDEINPCHCRGEIKRRARDSNSQPVSRHHISSQLTRLIDFVMYQ